MRDRTRFVLISFSAVLLFVTMQMVHFASSEWRFYQLGLALQRRNYAYRSPVVGGGAETATFPLSVIVAAILAVIWVALTVFVVIRWIGSAIRDKAARQEGEIVG